MLFWCLDEPNCKCVCCKPLGIVPGNMLVNIFRATSIKSVSLPPCYEHVRVCWSRLVKRQPRASEKKKTVRSENKKLHLQNSLPGKLQYFLTVLIWFSLMKRWVYKMLLHSDFSPANYKLSPIILKNSCSPPNKPFYFSGAQTEVLGLCKYR